MQINVLQLLGLDVRVMRDLPMFEEKHELTSSITGHKAIIACVTDEDKAKLGHWELERNLALAYAVALRDELGYIVEQMHKNKEEG